MTIRNGIFTSEAVSAGHPDKICDQISDAILDACLKEDRHSRVAVETAVKGHTVCLLGEVSTNTKLDYEALVRAVLCDIGHSDNQWELDITKLEFVIRIFEQSGEIAHGVDRSELGAGDQGIMFGYATNETLCLMPAPIEFANRLIRRHSSLRNNEYGNKLGPDAKSQVSVAYENGKPSHIAAIVLSTQHAASVGLKELRQTVRDELIFPALGTFIRHDTVFHINPAGTFHSGGSIADAGLTGRKIIADTYGGYARHGGGAFSGKDASKVDRSAAYAARQIARHAVEQDWVDRCEIQISYAIGYEKPVSVDFVGDSENDADFLQSNFEKTGIDLDEILHPSAIINRLNLTEPIFQDTASGGHFGRPEFSWEQEIQI